jgi:hypothetical protein
LDSARTESTPRKDHQPRNGRGHLWRMKSLWIRAGSMPCW